jgi:ATP-binding cassette subfamily G (WHITE) protein 2
MVRGISGGERKRTSLGMELVASPSILYLDEPTTGLDAFSAAKVIQLLKQYVPQQDIDLATKFNDHHLLCRLSQNEKTIIFSIHQPKYSLFKMFDSITLLEKGQCVYHGPASESVEYFRQLGTTAFQTFMIIDRQGGREADRQTKNR